jgi:hypothetical protein
VSEHTTARERTLRGLKPDPDPASRRQRFSDAEIGEAILAYQRGVSIEAIGEALRMGQNPRSALRYAVGTWALRYCKCHGVSGTKR